MSYTYITDRTSPNKWVGGNTIKSLVIHWWGDPATNPSAEGVVNWLCNPQSQVSAHYVATGTGRRVWHLVNDKDRAWHAMNGNHSTLGIELDPRCRNEDYDVAAELIADLWKHYGKLPLQRHSDWVATACPGNYDLNRLAALADLKLNPPAPKPAPAPKPTITYEKIPTKSIQLVRDANLWDFSFTKWSEAKTVQSRKEGSVIENIVAIATNTLGAKYYVTKYSYDNKVTNGFNINDARDYVPEKPKPEPEIPPTPIPSPEPEPELPVTEKPDYAEENNAILKQILSIVQELLSKVKEIFK